MPDTTPPTLLSATAGEAALTLAFSEPVLNHAGFTLGIPYGSLSLTYSSGSGTAILVFAVSGTLFSGEALTVSYTPGDVTDLAGNALAGFSGQAVTNAGGTWAPNSLASLYAAPAVSVCRTRSLLWTDSGKTTLATTAGAKVRVVKCPWTGTEYTAPSDDARPVLRNPSGDAWHLEFAVDGSSEYLDATGVVSKPLSAHFALNRGDAGQRAFFAGGSNAQKFLTNASGGWHAQVVGVEDWSNNGTTLSADTNYVVGVDYGSSGAATYYLGGVSDGTAKADVSAVNLAQRSTRVGADSTLGSVFLGRIHGWAVCSASQSAGDIASLHTFLAALASPPPPPTPKHVTPEYTDPAMPLTLADYRLSVASTVGASTLTVDVTINFESNGVAYNAYVGGTRDPRYVESVMVWVDGERVDATSSGALTPSERTALGHTFTEISHAQQQWQYRWVFSLASLATTGGSVPVTVALFDTSAIDAADGVGSGDRTPRGVAYVTLSTTLPAATKSTASFAPARPVAFRTDVFPLSMFNAAPSAQLVSRGYADDLLAAGVNTLELGIFNNPRATGPATYAAWVAQFESQIGTWIDWCVANDFWFWGIGDDLLRDAASQTWMTTSPFAAQAVAYSATRCRDSGRCVGVIGQDEVGYTPDANHLLVVNYWRAVSGAPPLAWPTEARNSNSLWETAAYSDFDHRYTTNWSWRSGLPDGGTTYWELADQYETMLGLSDGAGSAARPLTLDAGCTGPFYDKYAAGSDYQPALDYIRSVGIRPRGVVAQGWLTLCCGATALRLYGFDDLGANWKTNRATAGTSGTEQQTGSAPGDSRWYGVSALGSSISTRSSLLLGTHRGATRRGPWVFGRWDRLDCAINCSETAHALDRAGTLVTEAGESAFAAGGSVPAGGVVLRELTGRRVVFDARTCRRIEFTARRP